MAFLDSRRQRASFLIFALGVALAIALWPFASGLVGAPVLYVIFAPVHRWLTRWLRPSIAAGLVLGLALLVIVGPGVSLVSLVASEAPRLALYLKRSTLLSFFYSVHVGPIDVGEQLRVFGERLSGLLAQSAVTLVGTATRLSVSVMLAFFGLYFLLVAPDGSWERVRPYIPFSARNSDILRERFHDVTVSTLVGTFLVAVVQGILVGLGFWVAGLPNVLVWSVATGIFSLLPLLGSGIVWLPGVVTLLIDGRVGMAIALAVWCALVMPNIDNLIRSSVYRHYAEMHPFVTVIGAFAGIQYFGLLGLLVGPLAISYFFELLRMYRAEYVTEAPATPPGGG